MSSEALREKLKIIFTKTTFSMLHVMSCFPPQEALTFFKTQFQKCECVSDKSCVKGTDPLSAHNDNLNCIEKFHYAPRTLAAASTSIHSISIQAKGGRVVSFFIQHPGNHPTMWRSRHKNAWKCLKIIFAICQQCFCLVRPANPILCWVYYVVHTHQSIHVSFLSSQPSWCGCRPSYKKTFYGLETVSLSRHSSAVVISFTSQVSMKY